MTVAILCGGLGTRLGALTADTPKSLVKVNGKPFILRQLNLLGACDLTDIVLCVGHLGDQIQSFLGDGDSYGSRIRYSYDGAVPLSPMGAIRKAAPMLGEDFMAIYGDSYLEVDWRPIIADFLTLGFDRYQTTWNGIDYGVTFFTQRGLAECPTATIGGLANYHGEATCPMPAPWQEIGSLDGLKALEAYLKK